MTSEDVYDIKRWHRDGKPVAIIAQLLDMTTADVRSVIGVEKAVPKEKQYNTAMIMNDWNAGKPLETIVRTHNMESVSNLYTFVSNKRKQGWKFKNKKQDRTALLERMLADWNNDMPVPDIVKKYGYKDSASICNAINWHRKQGKPFKVRNGGVEKRRNNERGTV